jgi:hypothetical protein
MHAPSPGWLFVAFDAILEHESPLPRAQLSDAYIRRNPLAQIGSARRHQRSWLPLTQRSSSFEEATAVAAT